MSSKKSKHKTLSEQVSDTFIPRPLADPEFDSEDETAAKFAQLDDDDLDFERNNQLSDFRKRNVQPLAEVSAKYKGKVSSRKEMESDEDDASVDVEPSRGEDSDDSDDLEQYRKKLKNCQLESEPDESLGTDEEADDEVMEEEASEQENDSDYDSPGEDVSQSEDEAGDDGKSELLKETDATAEIQKGLAVQSQLKMWEKLLEVRIHSQKMLIKANSLPEPAVHDKLRSESEEFCKLAEETQENVGNLLDKMIEIQTTLAKQFPETKDLLKPLRKRRADNVSVPEPPVKRFASLMEENFQSFRDYRNSVLQKWHDRTKILTPGSSKGGSKTDFDVVKKIDAVLLNKSDLVKKSQVLKGNYKLFGVKEDGAAKGNDAEDQASGTSRDEVSSVEVYDDTDFYHQQLRELIEFKANTAISPSEMNKQFAELQKLRHKMKKKVDTRASKGRKIRYVVHNKLVNFMAPYDNSEWTDESKNELYRSLFAT